MNASFKDILFRARRGDREALAEALSVVEDRVRRAAQKRLSPALRALLRTSDVLQTTYVEVVRQIENFRGDDPDAFTAWLTRMLENNIRDRARYHGRLKRRPPEQGGEDDPIEPDSMRSPNPSPSRLAMDAESLAVVGHALNRLDEAQRRVIELRMFEEREYDDIAVQMARTENAVRMLYSRARAALAMQIHRLQSDE